MSSSRGIYLRISVSDLKEIYRVIRNRVPSDVQLAIVDAIYTEQNRIPRAPAGSLNETLKKETKEKLIGKPPFRDEKENYK